jgi:hypothetical protein
MRMITRGGMRDPGAGCLHRQRVWRSSLSWARSELFTPCFPLSFCNTAQLRPYDCHKSRLSFRERD